MLPVKMVYLRVLSVLLLQCFTVHGQNSACDVLSATGLDVYPSSLLIRQSIREDIQVNSTIGSFTIRDANAATVYPPTHEYFQLQPNLSIKLIKEIDAETSSSLPDLKIDCFNGVINKTITIRFPSVFDVNEFAPSFTQQVYTVNISEATQIKQVTGEKIFDFAGKAVDKDKNNGVRFFINGNQTQFKQEENGELLLLSSVDFEVKKQYTLTIIAKDNDQGNPKSSTATLIVYVEDSDDQNPKFTGAPYAAAITENETLGAIIQIQPQPIQANDQDTGINSPILYSIENSNGVGFFSIGRRSGIVTLTKKGIKRGQVITVSIRATEELNAGRSDTAQLTVSVTAVNENPPKFDQDEYIVSVMENTRPGADVVKCKASDNDLCHGDCPISESAKDEYAYLNYSMDPSSDMFEIHKETGVIKLTGLLDYENVKEYLLKIQVTDGKFWAKSNVTIKIVDVNDNNPTFKKNIYVMNSDRKKGVIGSVSATDVDELYSAITYVLNTHKELFSIDSSSGAISLHAEPADITQNSYSLTIEARDSDQPPRVAIAHVNVIFPPLPSTAPTVKAGESKLVQASNTPLYALAAIAGFLLIVCIVLAVLTIKLVRKKRADEENAKVTQHNPTEGLAYNNRNRLNVNVTDFMDDTSTTTQENPLALAGPGYFYEDDGSDMHEGQLRRVDEILVGEMVHSGNQSGNKPMGSPTGSNSSTASLIGALKKDDDLLPKKKKSLSWGKTQQEVYNAEAPIDPDASVRPMDDDEGESQKPKITLYF